MLETVLVLKLVSADDLMYWNVIWVDKMVKAELMLNSRPDLL